MAGSRCCRMRRFVTATACQLAARHRDATASIATQEAANTGNVLDALPCYRATHDQGRADSVCTSPPYRALWGEAAVALPTSAVSFPAGLSRGSCHQPWFDNARPSRARHTVGLVQLSPEPLQPSSGRPLSLEGVLHAQHGALHAFLLRFLPRHRLLHPLG